MLAVPSFRPQHCLQNVCPGVRHTLRAPVRAVRLDPTCRDRARDGAHVAIPPVRAQAADLHHLEGRVGEDRARNIEEAATGKGKCKQTDAVNVSYCLPKRRYVLPISQARLDDSQGSVLWLNDS